MEKNRKRAIRRHHIARLKNTRKRYFTADWWNNDAKRMGKIVQYPKMCSCTMCGNARKWFGHRTIDEHRGFDILKDGLDDYFSE
mgnify:CR=1 FL=1|jgi:hypothetical protein